MRLKSRVARRKSAATSIEKSPRARSERLAGFPPPPPSPTPPPPAPSPPCRTRSTARNATVVMPPASSEKKERGHEHREEPECQERAARGLPRARRVHDLPHAQPRHERPRPPAGGEP